MLGQYPFKSGVPLFEICSGSIWKVASDLCGRHFGGLDTDQKTLHVESLNSASLLCFVSPSKQNGDDIHGERRGGPW